MVVISWPLAWRGTPTTSDCSGQLGSSPHMALFGQPLALLCGQDVALPQPVQEMLAILSEKGPATEGIFQKVANEKARRELREELDRGGNMDLTSQPVHLLAVLLKPHLRALAFLRNIPYKLLVADLYNKWLLALQQPSLQEKIAQLRVVAGKLPPANCLLLQRLLSVLHRISEKADRNRMDASNLVICVGPNLLSPTGHAEREQETSLKSTKGCSSPLQPLALNSQALCMQVTLLVKLLTDNCAAVFGDIIAWPFRPSTEESPEHTDSSRGAAQQNHAAFNSPNPEADGSPTTSGLEQPKAASAFIGSSYPACLSAPSLTNWRKEISSMHRSFSEADLSSQISNLQGSRRAPEVTKSREHFSIRSTKHSLEKEALETTPCRPKVTLSKWHSVPKTSSRCSCRALFSSDGLVFTSSTLASLPSPPESFLKTSQPFPIKPKEDSSKSRRYF
ncbi:LOW QUALITY PROTEIN: T-cell activation Rho GTPase-activating protein-like [Rhea pennata]|uniref:LOW QUALITY PROTEIN: T-cell activation Rho GTPase-activating protein-like n=1 Tax=Rhea pennata TaxID=8795 RepID=UPI002E260BBA